MSRPFISFVRSLTRCANCPHRIGPRKLAEALVASRLQWEENRNAGCNQDHTTPEGTPLTEETPDTTVIESNDYSVSPSTSPSSMLTLKTTKSRPRLTTSTPGTAILGVVPLLSRSRDSIQVPPPPAVVNGGAESVIPSMDGLGLSDIPCLSKQGTPEPNKRFILIVDDNAINIKARFILVIYLTDGLTFLVQILTAYMMKLEHPCVPAMNGLEAFQIYNSNPEKFRCIVTGMLSPSWSRSLT